MWSAAEWGPSFVGIFEEYKAELVASGEGKGDLHTLLSLSDSQIQAAAENHLAGIVSRTRHAIEILRAAGSSLTPVVNFTNSLEPCQSLQEAYVLNHLLGHVPHEVRASRYQSTNLITYF